MVDNERATVVIDTCVILDMFLADRPRHATAKCLLDKLVRDGTRVVIPYTGLFEGIASLTRIRAHGGRLFTDGSQCGCALEFSPISIDDAFFRRYYYPDLPSLRTNDLLLFALAKREGYALITEDDELYTESEASGVSVFRIVEYVNAS